MGVEGGQFSAVLCHAVVQTWVCLSGEKVEADVEKAVMFHVVLGSE